MDLSADTARILNNQGQTESAHPPRGQGRLEHLVYRYYRGNQYRKLETKHQYQDVFQFDIDESPSKHEPDKTHLVAVPPSPRTDR